VLATIFVIVTVAVPTFVTVTGSGELVVPCACPPKASVAGNAVTTALVKLPA
jgi:hypothetical protein